MAAYRHGLVIGKFYPPHRGHHWLIREATSYADRISVVVMSSANESLSLADRLSWLRAEHAQDAAVNVVGVRCDAPVDIDDAQVWAAQVAIMRAAARSVTDDPVDVVITSEAYGPELAQRFGAAHVVIPRTSDGLSASLVRHDLVAQWDELAPATRAGLAVRVVVLGADSTGTTSVCRRLAEHYRSRGGVWSRTAIVEASGPGDEDVAGSPLLVRHSVAPLPRSDVHLLNDDGSDLTQRFEDALIAAGHSWVLLSGTIEQRVALAIRTIDPFLDRRLHFAAPKTGPGFEATVIG